MQYKGSTNEKLRIYNLDNENHAELSKSEESDLTLLWFTKDGNHLAIDGIDYEFKKNQIICLTEFHQVEAKKIVAAQMIRFNRPFYCILDHDSEVGCKGVLFFGASSLPVIYVPEEELRTFETVFEMFVLELKTEDNLQLEMLQMMLKRFLILCARVYKKQEDYMQMDDHQIDIVREYNFLVEQHFKTKHTVAEYADLLFKSPKTLSNLFSKISSKTPLQYIQDRKMLEARRLLRYTDKSVKHIAIEIGFEDIQTFGRFFKKNEGVSPSFFRENKLSGKIAHPSGKTT
ncbi:helix-turn-helix domain-containing protein [Labilibacter marinus]|uniref:helix-turn-helix domain-containing protein n=1 Tax=Labilibacter marinus TaxID=1477105 RepID=UPI0008355FED|nr:helix-turn-helix transcriptional regulator [Labilibacter marinus]